MGAVEPAPALIALTRAVAARAAAGAFEGLARTALKLARRTRPAHHSHRQQPIVGREQPRLFGARCPALTHQERRANEWRAARRHGHVADTVTWRDARAAIGAVAGADGGVTGSADPPIEALASIRRHAPATCAAIRAQRGLAAGTAVASSALALAGSWAAGDAFSTL